MSVFEVVIPVTLALQHLKFIIKSHNKKNTNVLKGHPHCSYLLPLGNKIGGEGALFCILDISMSVEYNEHVFCDFKITEKLDVLSIQ